MSSTLTLSVATSIVLVEDDPAYAEIVGEGLKEAWPGPLEVTSYELLADARAGLEDFQPDCVLLDLSLPDGQGLEVLAEVVAVAPRTPVIVLTGREERDGLGAEAVRLGAQDYLVKGQVSDEVVARSVRYAMERKRGELERQVLEARYAQEAMVAATLQRGLVPGIPRVPGLEIGARYLPSEPAGRVGGDWYDVIPLPGGRVVVVVGDVAGHGIHAASLMGQLATAVRAYALDDPHPERVLVGLSRLLEHFSPDDMATVVCVVLDGRTGTALHASAGHPPAMILRGQSGHAELITGGRTAVLGFTPHRPEVSEERLDPGDTLVLYTDGLIERRGEDLSIGIARLQAAAEAATHLAPPAFAGRLVDELAPRETREDDVAVLAVRVTGS
jgi:serine phosphatase RsbU (regulator of sigma subunit)